MNAIDVPEVLPDPPVKVQYFTATTLDGFIADADNSLDWLFVVERDEGDSSWEEFIGGVGALVMGATTYEWVLGHEPEMLEGPEKWRSYYDDRPCWVFTHRELPRIPGIELTFVQGDVRPVYDEIVAARPGPRLRRTSGSSAAATWSASSTTPACSTRSGSGSPPSRWAGEPRCCPAASPPSGCACGASTAAARW